MTNLILTRREMTRCALAGAAGVLLSALPTQAQAVDAAPVILPPLPLTPVTVAAPVAVAAPASGTAEGKVLVSLVPLVAGYALTETQAKEVALQLQDYPGDFAQVRVFTIPDDVGPAFAANAPIRKERTS
jgi:hypothetical protein